MLTRLAAKHQGFVVSSDIATKGSKLIVTFGAPVAHEYAPANAARFALDLNAGLRESGLDLQHKIGVNGGHVFAGEVGPPFRRQYTVMGDAVNLAARLMGAAELERGPRQPRPAELREPRPLRARAAAHQGQGQGGARGRLRARGGGARRGSHPRRRLSPAARQGRLFGRRNELERARAQLGASPPRRGAGDPRSRATRGSARRGCSTRRSVAWRRRVGWCGPPASSTCRRRRSRRGSRCCTPSSASGATNPASVAPKRSARYLAERLPDLVEFGSLLNPLLDLSLPQSEVVGSLDAQARRARALRAGRPHTRCRSRRDQPRRRRRRRPLDG